ncbi:MAG TPA: phosphoribosylglycinamide formyltransferase, partial [Gemmatimonadota bacterium]|nr:phosphoribosylglycinamide formyltransferase [Gemmatimonadota bacterium]
MIRIAVLASGRGSNLEALFEALAGRGDVAIVLVASDRADAYALERARRRGVEVGVVDPADDAALLALLERARVDWIVLAGYLKRVPPVVVRRWRNRILNVHPALLPAHGGRGMYGDRVHRAVLEAGETTSGASVHLVDEEYDRGPVVARAEVPVEPGDTPASLAARVLEVEHRLLPAVVVAAA